MELSELTPLAGGWSAQTFLAVGDGRQVVVRQYDDGRVPDIDAALLRRARGLVPVPEVLDTGPGRLVTSYVEGMRGDLVVPTLDSAGLARLGADVGRIAVVLASTELPASGLFVDADLTIEPFGALSLSRFVADHRAGWEHWTSEQIAGLHARAGNTGPASRSPDCTRSPPRQRHGCRL